MQVKIIIIIIVVIIVFIIIIVVVVVVVDIITLLNVYLLGSLHLSQTVGGIRPSYVKQIHPIP